jgi:CBS domain containing-hemolysin-like protein
MTIEPETRKNKLRRLWTTVFGGNKRDLRESLEGVIDTHAQQAGGEQLGDDARSMMRNLIDFSDLRVDDVMVPRADIVALEDVSTMRGLLDIFMEANHSRIPIYNDTLDNILGMIHVKDFLRWITVKGTKKRSKTIAGVALAAADLNSTVKQHSSLQREVLFVPPSMPASDLLLKMKTSHIHLAIVIDEYGGTDGLVSFEDLMEEIVGDISDEHDTVDAMISKINDTTYMADARIYISKLDEMFKVDLLPDEEEDEADTLGGLVFEMGGRVPSRGEIISHNCGLDFEIMETDRRRVKRVRIHLRPDPETTTGD